MIMGAIVTATKVAAAIKSASGKTSFVAFEDSANSIQQVQTLHLWTNANPDNGKTGESGTEEVPSWLIDSHKFDPDAFEGRLEKYRQMMVNIYAEDIWPGEKVHAAYDCELVEIDAGVIAGAAHDAESRDLKAGRLCDTLLTALKALLEHEGTVEYTGIGELPSQALQDARQQAQSAIQEAESSR